MRILILLIFVFCYLGLHAQRQNANHTPFFDRSVKSLFEIKIDQDYEFGYLNVPENRSNPISKLISLPVYIFKSRSANPKKDPIIYLVGGPGSSIMNAVPYMKYYRYLDDRDLILIEQRGTEYAKPNLSCPDLAKAFKEAEIASYKGESVDGIVEKATIKCREKLRKRGIDLNGYNSLETVADLEDLRKALDIKEYNLLCLSYGAKIAQILMRDNPKDLRSVVMDSPLPLEADYDLSSAQNVKMVYDKLFRDCRNDSLCNLRYPDLERKFYSLIEQCNKVPLKLEVSIRNKKETYFINGTHIFYSIATIGSKEIPTIPRIMWNLLEGNQDYLKSHIESFIMSSPVGNGLGMRLSVWCSEEMSFINENDVNLASHKFPFLPGDSPVLYSSEICKIWDVKSAAPIENEAVQSDIPTLLISGEYDTFTPASWASAMLLNLEKGKQIIFKGWQHSPTTYWDNPCAMNAANTFFNAPSLVPNLKCIKELNAPVFVTE